MTRAELLAAWLAEQKAAPFSWPENNCSHYVAGWVEKATGRPVAVPRPVDMKAARRFLREYGTLRGAVSGTLGEPIPATLAQTGDVVLAERTEGVGEALGICSGRDAIYIDEQGSFVFDAMERAACAWRV